MPKGFTRKFTIEEHEYFKEMLHYDPITGLLTRLKNTKYKKNKGEICGTNHNGYLRMGVFKARILVHRICWVLYYGFSNQPRLIDHRNGIGSDNKIENLREATYEDNNHNSKVRKDSKTQVKCVYIRSNGKFSVTIKNNKIIYKLGEFDTIEEAEQVVRKKREELHKEFANHG